MGWYVSNSDGFGRENINMFDLVWLLCWRSNDLSAMCDCLFVNVNVNVMSGRTHTKLEYINAMRGGKNNHNAAHTFIDPPLAISSRSFNFGRTAAMTKNIHFL